MNYERVNITGQTHDGMNFNFYIICNERNLQIIKNVLELFSGVEITTLDQYQVTEGILVANLEVDDEI